jgi:Ca2+-transporting ATPase
VNPAQSQVANEINARRINDEYNVFEGLTKSPIFMGVIIITMGLQAIIINFLGIFFVVGTCTFCNCAVLYYTYTL